MRPNVALICFLCVLAVVHGSPFVARAAEEGPCQCLCIPIFPNNGKISMAFDQNSGTKTIHYRVRANQSAAEIIQFYDVILNGKGWMASFEICQRHWEVCDAGTADANAHAGRFFASWVHPEKNRRLVVWLRYKAMEDQDGYDVTVECRVGPED
jgi:hypothetical protein